MTTEIAGCIIQDNYHRVLLLHNIARDWWELPGGKVEPDETFQTAARREIREELGIAVRFTGLYVDLEYEYEGTVYSHHLFGAVNRSSLLAPEPQESNKHDRSGFHDLGRFAIGMIGLSPAAERLSRLIKEDEVQL